MPTSNLGGHTSEPLSQPLPHTCLSQWARSCGEQRALMAWRPWCWAGQVARRAWPWRRGARRRRAKPGGVAKHKTMDGGKVRYLLESTSEVLQRTACLMSLVPCPLLGGPWRAARLALTSRCEETAEEGWRWRENAACKQARHTPVRLNWRGLTANSMLGWLGVLDNVSLGWRAVVRVALGPDVAMRGRGGGLAMEGDRCMQASKAHTYLTQLARSCGEPHAWMPWRPWQRVPWLAGRGALGPDVTLRGGGGGLAMEGDRCMQASKEHTCWTQLARSCGEQHAWIWMPWRPWCPVPCSAGCVAHCAWPLRRDGRSLGRWAKPGGRRPRRGWSHASRPRWLPGLPAASRPAAAQQRVVFVHPFNFIAQRRFKAWIPMPIWSAS